MVFLAVDPVLTISLTTAGCLWLLVLADFLPSQKSPGSNELVNDSWASLLALTVILLSYVPILVATSRNATLLTYGIGLAGLLLYVRLQPKEFTLWNTPAKRLLTFVSATCISLTYALYVPSANYIPMIFAYLVLVIHRRAIHRTMAKNIHEIRMLSHKIAVANASLQNHATMQSSKTEDDNLRQTG
jgi:amino acid transporter